MQTSIKLFKCINPKLIKTFEAVRIYIRHQEDGDRRTDQLAHWASYIDIRSPLGGTINTPL